MGYCTGEHLGQGLHTVDINRHLTNTELNNNSTSKICEASLKWKAYCNQHHSHDALYLIKLFLIHKWQIVFSKDSPTNICISHLTMSSYNVSDTPPMERWGVYVTSS